MSDVDDFWGGTLHRYTRAVDQMHNGDPRAFAEWWSRREPVTLLGAAGPDVAGWENVTRKQAEVASRFSNGTAVDVELIAADVNGDWAYTVAYERSSVSVGGGPTKHAFLRATQIYRRESGDWKLAHRHADSVNPADSPATDALRASLKTA